jgi:hypothetical protein
MGQRVRERKEIDVRIFFRQMSKGRTRDGNKAKKVK